MDKTALLLSSLKTILANPALRSLDNHALAEAMWQADTVLAGLLARQIDMPLLLEEVRTAYAKLLPQLQLACAGHAAGIDAVARLQAALTSPAAPALEAILPVAVGLLDELDAIATPDAQHLIMLMVGIEQRFSSKYHAALRAAATPANMDAKAAATHVKSYDEDALRRFIVSQYPREHDIRIVSSRFIAGGASKYTMSIELSGNRELPAALILRADAGSGFGGSSVVEEYRLLKILHAHGVQVARPFAVELSGEVFGAPFMLAQKLPGRSIGHMFILPPPNRITAADIARHLANIHNVPVAAFGPTTAGANMTTREYALAWIDQSYASWKALDEPGVLMETSFRWLRHHVDRYEGRRTLVHGDYGLNNLLIDNDRLSCILDWEFAHIGNPVYDLGYFRFQAEALGTWDAFLHAYEGAGGVVPDERQIDYANLLAETRLTVMTRQAMSGYFAGIPQGVPGAINGAADFSNMSDDRIATILNRVM